MLGRPSKLGEQRTQANIPFESVLRKIQSNDRLFGENEAQGAGFTTEKLSPGKKWEPARVCGWAGSEHRGLRWRADGRCACESSVGVWAHKWI